MVEAKAVCDPASIQARRRELGSEGSTASLGAEGYQEPWMYGGKQER